MKPSSSAVPAGMGTGRAGARVGALRVGEVDLAIAATAVGEVRAAVKSSMLPHAGQRPFLPAEVAGAFNFLPHLQTTDMKLSCDT